MGFDVNTWDLSVPTMKSNNNNREKHQSMKTENLYWIFFLTLFLSLSLCVIHTHLAIINCSLSWMKSLRNVLSTRITNACTWNWPLNNMHTDKKRSKSWQFKSNDIIDCVCCMVAPDFHPECNTQSNRQSKRTKREHQIHRFYKIQNLVLHFFIVVIVVAVVVVVVVDFIFFLRLCHYDKKRKGYWRKWNENWKEKWSRRAHFNEQYYVYNGKYGAMYLTLEIKCTHREMPQRALHPLKGEFGYAFK